MNHQHKSASNINPTIIDTSSLIKRLIKHEGMKSEIYHCPADKKTIGVGRNLEDLGISKDELIWLFENRGFCCYEGLIFCGLSQSGVMHLLTNDINRVIKELQGKILNFDMLTDIRKQCLIDMCLNLGLSRFLQFKRMLAAITAKDWTLAAAEMRDSKWAKQVGDKKGQRAYTLAIMMNHG